MMGQIVRNPRQCRDKQTLIDEIRTSISTIMSIHNDELEDAINHESRAETWYGERLREARRNKMDLIERLGRHVSEHGC